MPVSVIVGGQFGSEGKGKVALEIVRRDPNVAAVVRVGGTNSGHTAITRDGQVRALRQLPAGAIDANVLAILPPGSFIDPEIFHREVSLLGLSPKEIAVSPHARIITEEHKAWEKDAKLNAAIGSTESGTGAAVIAMIARQGVNVPLQSLQANGVADLAPYTRHGDTTGLLRHILGQGRRVVIEGTQGFGLSVLHGESWPKATSRDTTAAGFLAEAGLSPRDVDDIILVIRCHPIRVAGDSGPLPKETTWKQIMLDAGHSEDLREYTTVTKMVRRVGMFDPTVVRRAIDANQPTRIVLNHLDYIDASIAGNVITTKAEKFVNFVESSIGQGVDYIGVGPAEMIKWHSHAGA